MLRMFAEAMDSHYNEWRPVNEYIKMKAEMKGW